MWALSLHLNDIGVGFAHQGGLDSQWLPWEPNAGCAWGETELLWSALGNSSLPLGDAVSAGAAAEAHAWRRRRGLL